MTLLALELHDAGVTAVAPGTAAGSSEARILGTSSPGFALLEGEELLTGTAARERSRLAPRRTHHRFWHALDAHTPLPHPFPRDWTAADLAHAHLERLWREVRTARMRATTMQTEVSEDPARVVLVVPGSFGPEALGLLLGICGAAGLPVSALMDLALAAAAGSRFAPTRIDPAARAHRLLHFDLHLHRAVVTELRATASGGLVRGSVRTAEGAGRVALEDTWARTVAAAFVRATRFDPLHAPGTEQTLYQRLAPWLERLEASDTRSASSEAPETAPFTLDLGGEERTVEPTRAQTVAAVEGLYQRLVEPVRALASGDEPPVLLLSSHATGLPGLIERLEAAGVSAVVPLSPGAAGRGALAVRDAVFRSPDREANEPSGGLPLVLRLPPEAVQGAVRGAVPGTHVGEPDGAA